MRYEVLLMLRNLRLIINWLLDVLVVVVIWLVLIRLLWFGVVLRDILIHLTLCRLKLLDHFVVLVRHFMVVLIKSAILQWTFIFIQSWRLLTKILIWPYKLLTCLNVSVSIKAVGVAAFKALNKVRIVF